MAEITNASDGIDAAAAITASVAVAVGGGTVEEALAAAEAEIDADSWLGRKQRQAMEILEQAGSGFAAVPLWHDHIANSTYTYGNVAPETVALALAIVRATNGDLIPAVQLATLIPKQSDSMPAMVGAPSGRPHRRKGRAGDVAPVPRYGPRRVHSRGRWTVVEPPRR